MGFDTSLSEGSSPESALVIGAGSAIAQALISELLQTTTSRVIAVSRSPLSLHSNFVDTQLCDYSETGIAQTIARLEPVAASLCYVFICNGILHTPGHQPEKRLEDLEPDALTHLFQVNAVLPALWLKYLLPVLRQNTRCVLTVLSARVGSISDNHKGGWYSYRASKAALNMLVRTAAVEYARRAPGIKLVAYHPGTVDTSLSRPFQKNVPPSQLMTPSVAARHLLSVVHSLPADGEASFIDWAGKPVEW